MAVVSLITLFFQSLIITELSKNGPRNFRGERLLLSSK